MGAGIKHPVPDRVKPSFVFFDIRSLIRSGLSVRQSARMSKITNDSLTRFGTGCFTAVPIATVGVKGLMILCCPTMLLDAIVALQTFHVDSQFVMEGFVQRNETIVIVELYVSKGDLQMFVCYTCTQWKTMGN